MKNSRRSIRLALPLLLLVAITACRGRHHTTAVQNEESEGGPRISSAVRMGDPNVSAQLLKGFSGAEAGTWRWTAGEFSVLLRSPLGSAQRGATLKFALNVPDVVTKKVGAITLTASIGSAKLKSETYSAPGNYTFTADVSAEQLAKDSVTIDFALDKTLPPEGAETRHLGVIAVSAGLESK